MNLSGWFPQGPCDKLVRNCPMKFLLIVKMPCVIFSKTGQFPETPLLIKYHSLYFLERTADATLLQKWLYEIKHVHP